MHRTSISGQLSLLVAYEKVKFSSVAPPALATPGQAEGFLRSDVLASHRYGDCMRSLCFSVATRLGEFRTRYFPDNQDLTQKAAAETEHF